MKEDWINTFLSDAEQDALRDLVSNDLLVGAVQKILLADVYYKGVLRKNLKPNATFNPVLALVFSDGKFDDEQLGRDVRAIAEGVRLVDAGFKRMLELKGPKTPGKPAAPNPGR